MFRGVGASQLVCKINVSVLYRVHSNVFGFYVHRQYGLFEILSHSLPMQKLSLIPIFTFSMFVWSLPSYAQWTKVTEVSNATIYVDYTRIREGKGYVYFWELLDLDKPLRGEIFSALVYHQGDCTVFRHKTLTYVLHKRPMGGGDGETQESEITDWKYFPPGSALERVLQHICEIVDK